MMESSNVDSWDIAVLVVYFIAVLTTGFVVSTLPEYMRKRFGGVRIRVYLAALSVMLYVFTKISVNLFSGALFLNEAFGWDIWPSIILLLIMTSLITIAGGLTAVLYTDTLQFFVMIIGAVALTIMSFIKVGGFAGLLDKYGGAIAHVNVSSDYGKILTVALANASKANNNASNLYQLAKSPMIDPSLGCSLPSEKAFVLLRGASDPDMPWVGFLAGQTPASIWYWCADQMMVQRVLAAKSLSHAQGATLMAGLIKQLPLFIMVLPGLISRVLYPGLRGLMFAVIMAALISDLTSIFNSASTMFTVDIYQRIRKRASNFELMTVGRLFVLFLVLASIAWIPVIKELQGSQLYVYIQSVAAYLAPPIASIYILAILWKRTNEKGAFFGLMYGLFVGLVRLILSVIYSEPICGEEDTRPWVVSKLHYMYFALFSFLSTALVAIVLSLLTKKPTAEQLHRLTYWTAWEAPLPEEEVTIGSNLTVPCGDPEKYKGITYTGKDYIPVQKERSANHAVNTVQRDPVDRLNDDRSGQLVFVHDVLGNKSSSFPGIQDIHQEADDERNCLNTTLRCMKHTSLWFCGCEDRPCSASVEEKYCGCCTSCCGNQLEAAGSGKLSEEGEEEQYKNRLRKITSLKQDPRARLGLRVGLVLIIILSVFCYIFFSVYFDDIEAGPLVLTETTNVNLTQSLKNAIKFLQGLMVVDVK